MEYPNDLPNLDHFTVDNSLDLSHKTSDFTNVVKKQNTLYDAPFSSNTNFDQKTFYNYYFTNILQF